MVKRPGVCPPLLLLTFGMLGCQPVPQPQLTSTEKVDWIVEAISELARQGKASFSPEQLGALLGPPEKCVDMSEFSELSRIEDAREGDPEQTLMGRLYHLYRGVMCLRGVEFKEGLGDLQLDDFNRCSVWLYRWAEPEEVVIVVDGLFPKRFLRKRSYLFLVRDAEVVAGGFLFRTR